MHLRPNEVHRNFSFRITANDAVTPTPECSVEVLLRLPVLTPLDGKASPQVRLDVPAYTDLPTPQHLPPGTGNVDTVVGTVVTLRAAADRPLVRAWVEYQPETSGAHPRPPSSPRSARPAPSASPRRSTRGRASYPARPRALLEAGPEAVHDRLPPGDAQQFHPCASRDDTHPSPTNDSTSCG